MNIVSIFLRLSNVRWFFASIGIAVWMIFHVAVLNRALSIDFPLAIWDSVVSNLLVVIGSFIVINIQVHYLPDTGKLWFALAMSFLMALLCQWAAHSMLLGLTEGQAAYVLFLQKSVPIRWGVDFLMIAGAAISAVFYYQLMDFIEIARRETTTEVMAKEAELQKLQQQLQPHFLFNSLNSVNAMISIQPNEAKRMVHNLSDFLRLTLRRADEHWITLADEWHYLQLYLAIEKVRFGHRLEVRTAFEEGALTWTIPTLLLQPLVENAIKFGLYGTTEGVLIEIDGKIIDGLLFLRVSNPFDSDMQPPEGSGFGLKGLRRRLYLLFARNDLLETYVAENKFTVILKIPVYHDQSNSDRR